MEIEPLGKTQASFGRLQQVLQENASTLQLDQPAGTVLRNWLTAARAGVLGGIVAVDEGAVLGLVIVRSEIAGGVVKLRSLITVPDSPTDTAALLVERAINLAWENPTTQHLDAAFMLELPGVREVFEKHNIRYIPRQEMRVAGLSGKTWEVHRPEGYRFEPLTDAAIPAAGALSLRAYRGTTDEVLMPELASQAGIEQGLADMLHTERFGVFHAASSTLVYREAEPVAFILCTTLKDRTGFVTDVCVDPAFRRQGLARAILSTALNAFAADSAPGVVLYVTTENPARLLYESLGFERTASFHCFAGPRPPTP